MAVWESRVGGAKKFKLESFSALSSGTSSGTSGLLDLRPSASTRLCLLVDSSAPFHQGV